MSTADGFAVADVGQPTVLVVDDELWNRTLAEAILEDEGFHIAVAADGLEALERIDAQPPDAVLLDVMMPGLDGFEVCRRLKSSRRTFFIPVLMLTALADTESKIEGLDAGADDFLNKPINRIELLTRLRALLRVRALRRELDSSESVIFSLAAALDAKTAMASDHSLRVAALAAATGRRMGLAETDLESLVWGALLHDVGKIGVPERVLVAAERDANAERLYRFHPLYSEQILRPLRSLRGALPIVRHHHERLDGSGFPDGLSGAAFTPPIEIVAAAVVYEVARSSSDDPEAGAAGLRAAVSGGGFRPEMAEHLVAAAEDMEPAAAGVPPELAEVLPVPSSRPGKVLVAAADAAHREIYSELLGVAGHDVVVLGDGEDVFEAVGAHHPDLVLAAARLPGVGEQAWRRLRSVPRFGYLPLVLVTAYEDPAGRERALAAGADDLLTLPLHREEMLARVRSLLRLRSYHRDLEECESVVLSMSGVLEAKDPHTNGHSGRVAELAGRLARQLGLGEERAMALHTAGLLHDLGKVAISESLLHKPGPLTAEEVAIVQTHPETGYRICQGLRCAREVLDCIRHHHERWDGSGYPDGLVGEAIPHGASILGLADAWDAITSERPYRAALSATRALAVLADETASGKWDPDVFAALEALYQSRRSAAAE